MLTTVLTYHVVPGKWDAAALSKMIKDGKGKAMIKTVSGGTLTARPAVRKSCSRMKKAALPQWTIPNVSIQWRNSRDRQGFAPK
jgi:uncharacterized surface protein with fasciclin (FAS1) repeats